MLEFVRALHYLSNEFMLGWNRIFPLNELWSVSLVEGIAFVAQGFLVGLLVAWIVRRISHDERTA
jgi:hypothetical protein